MSAGDGLDFLPVSLALFILRTLELWSCLVLNWAF